jgi:phosphatidate cytidylyltransferase
VLAVAFWLGAWGVTGLFALLSAVALREYTRVSAAPPERIVQVLAYAVALPTQYLLIGIDWYGLYSIFIPVYAFLVLPITAALLGDGTRFLERAAKTQWGLMICVFCISHVPALMLLDIPGFEGRNLLLIAYLVLVVQASDVLQYVWGKLAGRHPVAPRLSPSKTVEGAVGGILSATALGAALHGVTPFTPAEAAGLSFAVCLMGFLGGLVMSAIKRDAGAKDWGSLIEGHGGVLDRLDSVAFAAPVYFHLVRYWWTP